MRLFIRSTPPFLAALLCDLFQSAGLDDPSPPHDLMHSYTQARKKVKKEEKITMQGAN